MDTQKLKKQDALIKAELALLDEIKDNLLKSYITNDFDYFKEVKKSLKLLNKAIYKHLGTF